VFRSFSDVFSLHEIANVQSVDGSCDYSTDSTCATPLSAMQPPRSEATPPPRPSSVNSSSPDTEITTPDSELIPSVLDCLPLVLDNENDETWLSAVPQAALESVQEEEVKLETKPTSRPLKKTSSVKKPISERIKSSTDWIKTKIPKAPGRGTFKSVRGVGSPVIASPSPSTTKPSRSGRFSVELSTQSETRNHRFRPNGGRLRSTTV